MPASASTALSCTFCGASLDFRHDRCRGCGAPFGHSDLRIDIVDALSRNGRATVDRLAAHLQVGRARVAAALDEIEAAGVRLNRTTDPDAAEIDEVAQPEPVMDLRAALSGPWPANPVVPASSIAGMRPQPVPGQVALLMKRMRRRIDGASLEQRRIESAAALDRVAGQLAALGVSTASEMTGRAG